MQRSDGSSNKIKLYIKRHMTQIKRFGPLVIIAVVLIVTFATCSRGEAPQIDSPETDTIEETPSADPGSESPSAVPESPSPKPEPPSPKPEPVPSGFFDPLTGLPTETDTTKIRPLAIMINNNVAAQPQLGVSKADIIYEVPVEGGITRMMALYTDVSEVGQIGSIRSARLYYVDLAQSFDAVYIFAGYSPQAREALASRDITRLDGVSGPHQEIFYRDPYRQSIMSNEHTLVTTGDLIERWLPTYDFRLEHEEGYKRDLSFTDDGTPADGAQALDFSVMVSTSKATRFTYEEDDKLYYLSQHGSAYIDGDDSVQVSVTNVLVLKTVISGIPGDTEGRLNVATTGSGSGYFICGGRQIGIKWSRPDLSSQFSYTLADGSGLTLGRGKTYICIIPNENEVNFG